MASRKTREQCMTWLRSMAADRDSLDGINAELCLGLIAEQQNRLDKLGAQFGQMKAKLMGTPEYGRVSKDGSVLSEGDRAILMEYGIEVD